MAGLIAALFGGRSRPPDPDPLPGIGGYDLPRGPVGEGGFPGSTSTAPPTHSQGPDGKPQRKLAASAAQDQWKTLPTRRRNGTPRQPFARDRRQATDTEMRSAPVLSIAVPGGQNQRNTRFYAGRRAMPNGANRYVFGGENGGVESYAVQRRMPYRIHARPAGYRGTAAVRGADLSGARYTGDSQQQFTDQGGQYGLSRRRGPLHRPVRFTQPGPWSGNFYDAPPDEGVTAPDMVAQSPSPRQARTPRPKRKAGSQHPHRAERPEHDTRHRPGHVRRRRG